ncbi:fibronectin, type III domain-containing protein [Chloroflexus aggregans DSM 9485]|uniref:Fibronectin, type III domain-containing protein n=1 Tax=Chloroflexus aggregans (strain MD-66 / DSM 9485) TaxID=326427 RepID=B8G9M3_CHLAD|nr:fibronectin, type III domain-containing protein [Chloroflexus aggregans DSM 9485]
MVTTTNPLTMTISSNPVMTATFSRLNRAPAFTSTPVTTATQGAVYTYTVRASYPDTGDVLTITAPTKPVWLTLPITAMAQQR